MKIGKKLLAAKLLRAAGIVEDWSVIMEDISGNNDKALLDEASEGRELATLLRELAAEMK